MVQHCGLSDHVDQVRMVSNVVPCDDVNRTAWSDSPPDFGAILVFVPFLVFLVQKNCCTLAPSDFPVAFLTSDRNLKNWKQKN